MNYIYDDIINIHAHNNYYCPFTSYKTHVVNAKEVSLEYTTKTEGVLLLVSRSAVATP